MAFTPEQVAAALAATAKKGSRNTTYDQHADANYILITDFLTGKTTTLQGVQQGYGNQDYYPLIDLLSPLDPPTTSDHLLLSVLLHPNIFPFVQFRLLPRLMNNCIAVNTRSLIQFILGIFQSVGMTAEELYNYLVVAMRDMSREEWEVISTAAPLKEFLAANIPSTASRLINPSYNNALQFGYFVGHRFNPIAFLLVEEHRPTLLPACIKGWFSYDYPGTTSFLNTHRNGAYLPILGQMMTDQPSSNPEFQTQLAVAIRFFFLDKMQYRDPILRSAENYLQYWRSLTGQTYESRFEVPELAEGGVAYKAYTVVAWFLLLQYDLHRAVTLAQEWFAGKFLVNEEALELFPRYAGQEALPFLLAAAAMESAPIDFRKTAINILGAYYTPADYATLFWELVGNKSKLLRDRVIRILAEKDPEAEKKAIPFLQHKKAELRVSAATILNLIATPTAKTAMAEALNKESNDNARDILLETLADSLPEQGDKAYVDTLIAAADTRGKLSKPSPVIPDENTLPELFYATGEKLDIPAIRFLLYRMSRCKGINSDIEARYLIRLIDRTSSSSFADALLKTFLERQAAPEEKYLMLLAALLGDEDTAAAIRHLIDNWINNARFKMAEYGVGALAIQGSDKALRWVEWYSRKYTVKKANVGAAATAALEAAATELGITTYELGDRVVPDLGFDGLFRHFETGGESYRAFIDSKFKLAFFNENNKKLKAIPSGAPDELKQEFKDITKEVRDIVKSQSPRLEYYLVIQRRWNLAQWQKFFLNNPVMFIYATRLLWGVYKDHAESPDITFLCDEDTTLLDLQEEDLIPQPEWTVGIVHPSQLDPSTLRAWQERFFDKAIESVFPQLDRGQADLEGLDLSKTIIRKFDGRRTQTGAIRSTLDRRGWRPGPTGDGGMIGTYHLLHDEKKLEAILELEGVGAGFGWTGDERIGRLYFARREDPRKKWWHYPQDDKDPLLIPLKEIPALFLHETLAAIDAIRPAPAT